MGLSCICLRWQHRATLPAQCKDRLVAVPKASSSAGEPVDPTTLPAQEDTKIARNKYSWSDKLAPALPDFLHLILTTTAWGLAVAGATLLYISVSSMQRLQLFTIFFNKWTFACRSATSFGDTFLSFSVKMVVSSLSLLALCLL